MLTVYKRLILPVYFPTFMSSMVIIATVILLPLYMLELGYSITIASFVVAVRGIGSVFANIPAGLFANRYGDKPGMLVGNSFLIVAVLIMSLSDSLALILFASLLLGATNSLSLVARLSYITDSCANHERGRVIALMAGLARAGSLLGPLIFSLIAKLVSYKFSFMMMAVLICLGLISVALFAKNIPAAHRKAAPISGMFCVIMEHKNVIVTAGFSGLCLMMLRSARQLLFPLVGYSIGLDVAQVGLIFSISSAVDMLMFYPAGQIMDNKGRKWVAVPGMLMLCASLMYLSISTNYTDMLVFAVMSGLGNGITTGVLLTIGTDLAPEAERNQFIGIWRMQIDAGNAIAPLMVGAITDAISLSIAAISVVGFGFFGSIILALFVKETLPTKNNK